MNSPNQKKVTNKPNNVDITTRIERSFLKNEQAPIRNVATPDSAAVIMIIAKTGLLKNVSPPR
jgi:hypothetical protein